MADYTGWGGGLFTASLLDYPGQGVGLSAGHLPENTVTENSSGLDCPQSGLRLSAVQKTENRSSKTGYGLDFTAIYGLSVGWQRTVRNLNSKQSSRSPVLGLDSRTIHDARNRDKNREPKIALTLILPICGQISTNCHQVWYARSQDSREATSMRSSPNFKQINGESRMNEEHRKWNPRP